MIFGIISLLCFIAGGIFNACMDSRLDLGMKTKIYEWIKTKPDKWRRWYNSVGGNKDWNPSYPSIPFLNIWSSDYWHTCKWFMLLSWTLGVCGAVMSGWSWWVFLSAHGLHGFTFVLFYHYIIPISPAGSIKDYFIRVIKFWDNAHK